MQSNLQSEKPISIHSFGGLKMYIDGFQLVFPKKSPRRLLSLIKMLIAHGGQHVPIKTLLPLLWPGETESAALNKFYISVHRLRKLLTKDAIVQANGLVGFNNDLIELDTWQLQNEPLPFSDHAQSHSLCPSHFQQPWLPEDDSPWLEEPRRQMELAAAFYLPTEQHPIKVPCSRGA